jgi:hypothetical protein
MTSAQAPESSGEWQQIAAQDAVQISYLYNNSNPEAASIDLNFTNSNDYSVNVSWKDAVKFKNEPQVQIGSEVHNVVLAPNSAKSEYRVELIQLSTILASLEVENYSVLDLKISKN